MKRMCTAAAGLALLLTGCGIQPEPDPVPVISESAAEASRFQTETAGQQTAAEETIPAAAAAGTTSFETVNESGTEPAETTAASETAASSTGESTSSAGKAESSVQTAVTPETAAAVKPVSGTVSAESSHRTAPDTVCRASALYCCETGEMLWSDRIHDRIAGASTIKLLTAVTALKYLPADTVCTVGTELRLLHPHSSLCLIQCGHRMYLLDLLAGMLMASGNDAAYTAAVVTARAVSPAQAADDAAALHVFAGLMNETAAEIGMTESRFVWPDGWDDPEQFTTCSDLLILAEYALKQAEIQSIAAMQRTHIVFLSGENVNWTNTNLLLDPESRYYCADAVGLKTGTSAQAGFCLLGGFVRGGKTYLTAAAGCESGADRYALTAELCEMIPE